MLEVLARRHYREYALHDLRSIEGGVDGADRPRVVADYSLDERPTRLVSTIGTYAELSDPRGALASAIGPDVAAPRGGARRRGRPLPALARRARGRRRDQSRARSARGGAAVRPRRTTAVRRRVRRSGPSGGLLRVPSRRRRRCGRGHPDPWRAPDGRSPAQPLAAPGVRRHPHRGTRGRAAVRVRGAGEPCRPAARGPGPGPPAGGRPRRARPGERSPARRTCGGELPGGDPSHPRRPRCCGQQARHEPRVGPRLAGRRDRQRRPGRARQQDPPAHRRCRDRGGARAGARPRRRRDPGAGVRAVRRPARSRCGDLGRGCADRGAQAARRLRGQGPPRPAARAGLPVRAGADALRPGWLPRRARPRRHGRAGAGRATTRAEHRRHHRGRRHHADATPSRGCHPRGALRRPDEVAGLGRGGGVPADHRGLRPGSSGCTCRSSGSRCPRAPGSRWTPAPRTWTGSPRPCAGSWSSPRTAARSTSSWPASTWVRSPTGTPRPRCSCTPRASS